MAAGPAEKEKDVEEQTPLMPSKGKDKPAKVFNLGEVLFQLSAVAVFVVLGAGQAVATQASKTGGTLPYDASAAAAVAEGAKLIVSAVWVLSFDRSSFSGSIPSEWIYESLDLFFVAFLFAVTNEFNFMIVEKLGASLFMILGNLKIVFTCLFMRLMLNKRFAVRQWIAVAMLTVSAVVAKVPGLIGMEDHAWSRTKIVGLALLLISTGASGLAAVKNEQILKSKGSGRSQSMPFMAKNGVLYFWGFILNLCSWYWSGSSTLLTSFNKPGVISICCLVGFGLACAVILRYLDNVVRCFGSVAQVLLTVAMSRLLPASMREGDFGIFYAASLILLAAALVLYQAHESQQLHFHMTLAVLAAFGVACLCRFLDATH